MRWETEFALDCRPGAVNDPKQKPTGLDVSGFAVTPIHPRQTLKGHRVRPSENMADRFLMPR